MSWRLSKLPVQCPQRGKPNEPIQHGLNRVLIMGHTPHNQHSFETLRHHFDQLDLAEHDSGGPYKHTAVGQFLPSPLLHVQVAFIYLIEASVIDASGLLLDAGSGDGRIVALTALVHAIPTVGVEYDAELVGHSRQHLKTLKQLGLRGASDSILQGDFTDDDTYAQAGMRFEDFATVFNYINNEGDIALKVAQQSPPGTKLIILGAFPLPEYRGLSLEHNLHLATGTGTAHSVDFAIRPITDDAYIDPMATYLQVYRT
jgi:hypothetical protein